MPSKRPGGLNPIADGVLSSSDELAVYDVSTDKDLRATVAQLAVALKTVPGGTGATSLNGLSDVDAPTPANLQVLQFDSSLSKDPPDPQNPGAWTNATIAADTAKLFVVPTGGAQTPVDPLGGDPFSSLRFALAWVRANLRITTSLTIEFATGTYNDSGSTSVNVGGDGYLVILQPATGATVTLADTSGNTITSDPENTSFLSLSGRVNLTSLTITSRRVAVNCERGVSSTFRDCRLSPTASSPQIQLLQTRDMQLRFAGQCRVDGSCTFDNSISIANGGRLQVDTTLSPAIQFRGNADLVIGTSAVINLTGAGQNVSVANANGINRSNAIWQNTAIFLLQDGQPVRSTTTVAGVTGLSRVDNMVSISQSNYDNRTIGVNDNVTLYLIP
jgi:hypothetical protein